MFATRRQSSSYQPFSDLRHAITMPITMSTSVIQHENTDNIGTVGDNLGAADSTRNSGLPRQVLVCGLILLAGYVALFCLLQAPAFWYDLRPDPVRSLFPDFFRPINLLFPDRWVNLARTDRFALITVPIYLAMVACITGPLLYLLRRMARLPVLSRGQTRSALFIIFGFTLVIMLVLLFVRGLLSSDIYNYAWYSRIWSVHGVSPYTHVPSQFPPDPEGSIYWIGWANETAVYGPAWLMISTLFYKIGLLVGGSFSAQLMALRLLADGAHLLNAYLVWKISGPVLARVCNQGLRLQEPGTGTVATEDERSAGGIRLAAVLFYIWNPLMLIEFAGSGHNDVVMLTFVLLSVWLYLKGWWWLAALALGVGTLVKLPALIFVPGFLWLLIWDSAGAMQEQPNFRRYLPRVWRVGQALGIMLAAWAVVYVPFWEGLRTLLPLVSGPSNRLYLHSLPAVMWWNAPEPLANLFGTSGDHIQVMEAARQFLSAGLRPLFLGLLGLGWLFITWRARTFSRALVAWGWVALLTIVTQGWFWPWYVSWVVAIAAIAPSRRLRNTALIFTVSALLHYMEEQILGTHFKLFLDWSGVLIMAPPLLYALFSWLLELGGNRKASTLLTSPANAPSLESPGTV